MNIVKRDKQDKKDKRDNVTGEETMGKIVENPSGYVDEAHIVELVQVALVEHGNVILRGDAGTGKTYLTHWMTGLNNPNSDEMWEEYNLLTPELQKFSCHEEMGWVDVMAQDILQDGETRVRKQIMLQWLEPCKPRKPKILLIDEANFLSPSVAGFLHPLCDWQQGIWVPELNEFVKRSELHWIVMCVNDHERAIYAGTKQMNAALSSRFAVIDVPYMSMSAEETFLRERFPKADKQVISRLVAFADKTRIAFKNEQISLPITPRHLITFIGCMQRGDLSLEDIEPMILGVYSPDQQKAVEGLLEGKKINEVFSQVMRD